MAKVARECILEHFRAVLGLEWITYAWSKVDGRFEDQKRLGMC